MLPPRSSLPLIPVKRFRMRDTIPRCDMAHSKLAHRDARFRQLIPVNPIARCETKLRADSTVARLARNHP
jgi:hypothetical protein